ncbi:MAG: uracil-DNA glycosylase, partial [Chloroflexi bacterium]
MLEAIAAEVRDLVESPLYGLRREQGYLPVVGEGDPDARIMFIGEAPGAEEARKGRPFVGAAGRVLEELLASIGLERSGVYITNVVKDRPPGNRDPVAPEIKLYGPFLVRQIEIIQPRVIATLGRFALAFVLTHLGSDVRPRITDLHGQPIDLQAPYGPVSVVPLFHPAST